MGNTQCAALSGHQDRWPGPYSLGRTPLAHGSPGGGPCLHLIPSRPGQVELDRGASQRAGVLLGRACCLNEAALPQGLPKPRAAVGACERRVSSLALPQRHSGGSSSAPRGYRLPRARPASQEPRPPPAPPASLPATGPPETPRASWPVLRRHLAACLPSPVATTGLGLWPRLHLGRTGQAAWALSGRTR